MPIHTKMICTIGPSCNTIEHIIGLIRSGMNVARLNFSHGLQEQHLQSIDYLKEARHQLQVPLAIMLDTKGPEVRIGKIKEGFLNLTQGHRWRLISEVIEGNSECVTIFPALILNLLKEGTQILFDDGYISAHVISNSPEGVLIELENGGLIKSGKGVNIPAVNLNLPAITERDEEDIKFGCRNDIDIIAASFVRSPDDIMAIKKLLAEEKKSDILVIAKIENAEGVQNFDGIVQAADGIMIARGDLGVEIPLSQVPRLQKMMIRKSYLAGKPAVTATQMLESMIYNPRPTRAEVSDVANAIYDSTSSVMLSGETAIGKYPFETVRVMQDIAKAAEADFDYRNFFDQHSRLIYHDVPSSLTLAAVKTAYSSDAKAIFAFTNGGSTARLLSRLRPSMPIIALTHHEKCYHQMAFNWGVIPVLQKECKTIAEAFDKISAFALAQKLVEYGDLVVITAGSPYGVSGTTNMMLVENIGEVLVRGENGQGQRVHGNVSMVLSAESTKAYAVRDQLLVIGLCDESYLPLIAAASAIILQNQINDTTSEKFLIEAAKKLNKPFLVRADGAMRILKEDQLITLDPEKNLVYKGVVL